MVKRLRLSIISSQITTCFKALNEKSTRYLYLPESAGSRVTKIATSSEASSHLEARANCVADDACAEARFRHPSEVGRLPDWIPGAKAALMHNGKLISKKQDECVTTAATAPRLRKRLIEKSNRHDPFLTTPWEDAAFDDIDWKSV